MERNYAVTVDGRSPMFRNGVTGFYGPLFTRQDAEPFVAECRRHGWFAGLVEVNTPLDAVEVAAPLTALFDDERLIG